MDQPPQPPEMRRSVVRWLALGALLAAFAALPALASIGVFPSETRDSVLHVAVVFVTLMVAFRVMGKRELGRLSPFELVTLMLIPEVLSSTMQGEAPLVTGLAGLSTILLLVLVISVLSHRFEGFQTVVESPPTVLVAHGKLVEANMNRERVAPDELFSEMHKQGMFRLAQVRWAVLESSGNITFVPMEQNQTTQRAEDSEPL
jgi:uncharacterized membrane protein YcaP (DUF421 family)